MSRFSGVDYFLIDSLFNEQELLVRQTARQFVEERVMPVIRDCFRDGRFPTELIPEMGRLGFLGANLEGYGCAGMSNVEYGLIMQELERGDSGLRSFVSVQGALVMYPDPHATDRTSRSSAGCRGCNRGEALGCFGLTEPGFRLESRRHADPAPEATAPTGFSTARRPGSPTASVADVAIVWARAEEGIRGFLVERGTPGFHFATSTANCRCARR